MKKTILTIALAAFAFAANAQLVVGGQLGVSCLSSGDANQRVVGTTTDNWKVPATSIMALSVMPKIGYELSDNMEVGLSFGVEYSSIKMFNTVYGQAYTAANPDAEDWNVTTSMSFTAAPYFRYYLFELTNDIRLFCEAELGFAYTGAPKTTVHATAINSLPAIDDSYDGNTTSIDAGIVVTPGLNYRFSDLISADLYIDLLGIGFIYNRTNTFTDNSTAGNTNTMETTSTTSGLYLTADASAHTLTDHFGMFRLGFNFHF